MVDGRLKAHVGRMVLITSGRLGLCATKMGPKLMNRCKPEKWVRKKMKICLKRILILEEERVPARNARGREIEGQKKRVIRKDYKRLREEFEVEGFMARRGSWHIAKKRMLEDRGALPREDGDLLREYQAMHEENFCGSWLREDVEGEKRKYGEV